MSPSLQVADAVLAACAQAARRAANHLHGRQHADGYWWADLTADSTLESDFILLELWRHPVVEGVWNPPTRALIDKAARSILVRQLPDGGFNIYAQGPSEISATVKAYTALRLAGQIIFEEFGGSPANSYTWVELRDDLTVSLLQARLIELNLPINVAVGTRD